MEGETALKPACIINKLHPDIKSASSEKLAPLNSKPKEPWLCLKT